MMLDEEWVKTAMIDDSVVVEVLVRLKKAQANSAPPKSTVSAALRWGIRQPRSRSLTMRCKEGDSNRGSPTTPLSWSGGGGAASPSTADGFEESSRNVYRSTPATGFRSKGTSETTCTSTKRSRRKKTFAELKEEENLLLKERSTLKKEIASMRATFKEQRAKNENLKKIKLDLNLHNSNDSSETLSEEAVSLQNRRLTSSDAADNKSRSRSGSCKAEKAMSNEGSSFMLPDLNMMPAEDDFGPESFH